MLYSEPILGFRYYIEDHGFYYLESTQFDNAYVVIRKIEAL